MITSEISIVYYYYVAFYCSLCLIRPCFFLSLLNSIQLNFCTFELPFQSLFISPSLKQHHSFSLLSQPFPHSLSLFYTFSTSLYFYLFLTTSHSLHVNFLSSFPPFQISALLSFSPFISLPVFFSLSLSQPRNSLFIFKVEKICALKIRK